MSLNVLSIAGFDPSGGAGITADLKTFEAHGVNGFGVCTALTVQNDVQFDDVKWVDTNLILAQIEVLTRRFHFNYVKIGLVENFNSTFEIINHLQRFNPQVKIIWDPILKASAGFTFHPSTQLDILKKIYPKIHLITPNTEEYAQLFGDETPPSIVKIYGSNILLKGGHEQGIFSTDTLFTHTQALSTKKQRSKLKKHGTGCVLSAAITAYLARGASLPDACRFAQDYVVRFINSNEGTLGNHDYSAARF